MPKRTSTLRIERYLLNLAGEYRVCSELNKRGIFATVTYGCRKGADVYAIGDHNQRALRIEVKTSQKGKFVTGITQKGLLDSPTAPDFWVLFHLRPVDEERFSERFFVLSHGEMCDIQSERNRIYDDNHRARHGTAADFSRGVDNVLVGQVEQHEDRWSKIVAALSLTKGPH